jgi:hypothetical protein
MAEPEAKPERVEIGFDGGQVVAARLDPKQLAELRTAVEDGDGWHSLTTVDGDLAVDTSKVVFVRVAAGEHRIGFSQAG